MKVEDLTKVLVIDKRPKKIIEASLSVDCRRRESENDFISKTFFVSKHTKEIGKNRVTGVSF